MTLLEDMRSLNAEMDRLAQRVEDSARIAARHEEQISGERGILAAIRDLTEEMRGFKKALWGAGLSVLTGVIIFSVSLLAATGQV